MKVLRQVIAKCSSELLGSLIERGAAPDRVVLLYGKMEEDEFALDFTYPLSLLNAFAIVITTAAW